MHDNIDLRITLASVQLILMILNLHLVTPLYSAVYFSHTEQSMHAVAAAAQSHIS